MVGRRGTRTFAPWEARRRTPIVVGDTADSPRLTARMTSSGGVAARPAFPSRLQIDPRSLRWLLVPGAALVGAALLVEAAGLPIPAGHVVRLLAAAVALAICLTGWQTSADRARRVRSWIAVALAIWLASEVIRLLNVLNGRPADTGVELAVVGLGIAACGAYASAVAGRLRPTEVTALYLDAATVFATCTAVLLVAMRGTSMSPEAGDLLIHLTFFVGTLGATAILDLATRVPPRVRGAYGVLIGLLLGSIGYLGLLILSGNRGLELVFHGTLGAAAIVAGYGGANWTDEEDHRPGYEAFADRLRELLPISAVGLAPILVIVLVLEPSEGRSVLGLAAAVVIGLVVLLALVRQTLLLRDREHAVRRERTLRRDLAASQTQYRSVVDRVPGVVYVADVGSDGRWHYVSPSVGDILGYEPEEWLADPTLWERSLHPDDRDRILMAEAAGFDVAYTGSRFEYRLIARDGREVWVLDDEEVISRDQHGRPLTVQGILVDISDRKNLEEQLRHQALHDPLTGLPNRVLFADRVEHALARRAGGLGVAVLFLDIDDFKTVNDSLGHHVGDDLLRRGAERIAAVLRPEDTACRLGGDEFAVLLEDVDGTTAAGVAERILAALRVPFALGGHDVVLRASIGVAMRQESGAAADELLRDADNAMYAAKSLGKGRVQVFEGGMEQPILRRLKMRSALEAAVERDELRLEYQPIVRIASGEVIGVEALTRWIHPELGRVMPGEFVPLAEEIGLIGAVGAWVLETACREVAASSPTAIASVNISAHQLGSGDLPLRVAQVLDSTKLAPQRLMLELTESTLAAAGHGAEVELAEIHKLGVRIALDDFGSGYSSLEYLGRLPVDVMKVDRSLVATIDQDPQRRRVLKALGKVARELGLDTIVEGVERSAQRQILLELGFRTAQGYLLGRPAALDSALHAALPVA